MSESGAREQTSEHLAPIVPIGFSSSVAEALPKAVRRIVEALQPEKIIFIHHIFSRGQVLYERHN